MNNLMYNTDTNNTQQQVKSELYTFGVPLMKSVYNMNYPEPDQKQFQQPGQPGHMSQQQQQQQQQAAAVVQQQQGANGYGYETRYYPSPVIMQQPFQSAAALPPQPQWVETYAPVNNYLLIPNSSIQYNQGYGGQKPPPPPVSQYQQPDLLQVQMGTNQHHQQQVAHHLQHHAQHPTSTHLQHPTASAAATASSHQHHPQLSVHNNNNNNPAGASHLHHHQQQQHHLANPDANIIYAGFKETLRKLLPAPPLSKTDIRPDINYSINQKRVKRRSKFTKAQDDMIVALKKKGKSWVEIAEISKVGSYLAARNRYQVIVGQQGNNNSLSWGNEDKDVLRTKLDVAELEKWEFLALELNKATGKNFTSKDCREAIQILFFRNPLQFGVNEVTIQECEKEYKITEKANEQDYKNVSIQPYVQTLLANSSGASGKPFDRQQLPQHQPQNLQGQAVAPAPNNHNHAANAQGPVSQSQPNAAITANQAGSPRQNRLQPQAGQAGGHQPALPHFKSANSVFDNNVAYGFGEEYSSSRLSLEPVDAYKNQMSGYY